MTIIRSLMSGQRESATIRIGSQQLNYTDTSLIVGGALRKLYEELTQRFGGFTLDTGKLGFWAEGSSSHIIDSERVFEFNVSYEFGYDDKHRPMSRMQREWIRQAFNRHASALGIQWVHVEYSTVTIGHFECGERL